MGWLEPVMTPLTHYMVVAFEPPESAFTSVLVRIWMPPLVQVGAVRYIDKIALLQQLLLFWLCGNEGDRCTCYINTRPLFARSRKEVVEGDYLTCWKFPNNIHEEVVSVPDSDQMETTTGMVRLVSSQSSGVDTPQVMGACGSWTAWTA